MKNNDVFKKYILFMLLSASVVCAATFYFHVSDSRKNTTTIIIDNSTEAATEIPDKAIISSSSAVPETTVSAAAADKAKAVTTHLTDESETLYIDINTADRYELMKLSGIGEKLAEDIIRYRSENGRFNNIEEITKVYGIGEKILENIRGNIYVNDPVYEEKTESVTEEQHEAQTEHIPTLDEIAPIDINTADTEALMLLPHVDEETAERIIEFREKSGGFSSEYELLLIDGLTKQKVSDIMEYIEIK